MGNNHCLSTNNTAAISAWRGLSRLVIFSLLWYGLTGADRLSWVMGIPAVLLATFLSLRLAPSSSVKICLIGLCRFIPFFLYQSLYSGIDVMHRAFSFRQNIDPGLIVYVTCLPEGSARVFFANIISLLPGTLSAELKGNQVTIHSLDKGMPVWANIQRLEHHIAALMGRSGEGRENR